MCLVGLSAGLTAAAMAEALKLQKMRMLMGFHGNSDQQRHHNGAESENDDTGHDVIINSPEREKHCDKKLFSCLNEISKTR